MKTKIKNRLEYLRREINAERISYGEILELQSLSEYIEQDDVFLREWAGIPEFSWQQQRKMIGYNIKDRIMSGKEILKLVCIIAV